GMADLLAKIWFWFRRSLCIGGGGVAAAVCSVSYAVIGSPITESFEDKVQFLAVACPTAGVIGGIVGALIVFRAEGLEARERERPRANNLRPAHSGRGASVPG